jgi:DeoR family glycerol-3-phosphate regulon repressor
VADHSKFGRPSLVELGPLSRVTALFTDSAPPPEMRQAIAESQVELYIAP